MPLYEYQCEACGERCEILQKVDDPLATHCPNCEADSLKRVVSAVGFKLTGTGWYVTDFRDKGKTQKEATDKKETTDKADQKPEEKKTETKAKTKEETKTEE